MRRRLLLSAAVLIVAANVWVLVSARQNRREAVGGTLQLTERELPLADLPGESTATVLRLNWDVPSEAPKPDRAPAWLNAVKLAELGFDCHVPVAGPFAREHYTSLMPRPVFVVLEFEGDAWRRARPDRESTTRLFAVDAGRDAVRLRARYPETNRYAIVRGSVRPFYEDRNLHDGTPLALPRLRGWVEPLLPDQVFVPQPQCRALADLRHREAATLKTTEASPRYTVTVSWGTDYEPWVRDVVRLPAEPQPGKVR